ncbi:MAG: BTAD domain-containing putative transcriptional regulator [Blastocatellia bacterium]
MSNVSAQDSQVSSLKIHLLGPFRISVGGSPVEESLWQRRKARTLVKLLALAPRHRLHREQLIEHLFPELDPESAARNLNKTIHAVRRVLEPQLQSGADSRFIVTQDHQVMLRAPGELWPGELWPGELWPSELWIDVEVFERQAAEALKGDDPARYEAALQLYGGDLLGEDRYEEWTAVRRRQLQTLRQELLARLARLYQARGEYQLSIERLKELIACDEANEEAHRQLMRLFALTGSRHQALQQYRLCGEAVRREMDAAPESATVALYEQIVAGQMPGKVALRRSPAPADVPDVEQPALDWMVGESLDEPRAEALTRAPDATVLPPPPARPRYRVRRLTLAVLGMALLALGGIGLFFLIGQNKTIDSLAVLPLVNESADPGLDYLAGGLTESLINRLSQLPGLHVMSASTVSRYKGGGIDPREVGRELGVRAVFSGRVLQQGDRLVIKTELIEVADGSQLWGEQYNQKLAGLLLMQEKMTQEISEKLRLRLSAVEQQRLAKRETESTDAYQAYLKGRYFWNKRTGEGFKKGIAYFEQAIELDPAYALAYTGLADSYILMARFQFLAPREAFPKARAAAEKALAIDRTLAEAETSAALVKLLFEWDWAGAEKGFKRALALNPRDDNALHWYSHYLMMKGQMEEAARVGRQALDLDPLALTLQVHQARYFYYFRQYEQAAAECRKALEMNPAYSIAHLRLGKTYLQQARYEDAIAELDQARALDNQLETVAWLGYADAASGRRAEALRLLGELMDLAGSRYVSPYSIAIVYTGLGEKDQALAWLDKACADRSEELIWLKLEPGLDRLRSDPRFASLLKCVGLQP